jgi:CheY-like chemotaxis protein/HPt (histidine-containing phosphotransfer) domain-containing protein
MMQRNKLDFARLRGKRIMVVEDMELNQYLARHILESWGCEVTIAVNGVEALQFLEQFNFDCVLMDVQMPEMDGIEATQSIRQLADYAKASIPIIAFTANTMNGDKEKYLAAGMNDYLAKPFDERRLFQVLAKFLIKNSNPEGNDPELNGTDQKTLDIPGQESKLYDLSLVQSVSEGDSEFLKKMILLFIKTVPQNVEELRKALQTENWDQVRKMAHKLKSTVDSMGVKSIRQDIRLVESNAKDLISLDQIPNLVQKIEIVISQCIEQLMKEIA